MAYIGEFIIIDQLKSRNILISMNDGEFTVVDHMMFIVIVVVDRLIDREFNFISICQSN